MTQTDVLRTWNLHNWLTIDVRMRNAEMRMRRSSRWPQSGIKESLYASSSPLRLSYKFLSVSLSFLSVTNTHILMRIASGLVLYVRSVLN